MTADDAELAHLRTAFETAGPPPDPASCPSPGTILAAVRSELPPDDIRTVVDHTAACPACAEDWRLAVAFEEESADPAVQTRPAPARSPWHRHLSRYAAAAAAVVLLALGLQTKLWNTGGHPVTGTPTGITAPSTPVESPLRGDENELRSKTPANLPREQCLLVWEGGPVNATYDVEVYEPVSGDVIATKTGSPEARFLVPESMLRDLPAGARLKWTVTTILPGKALLPSRKSKTFSFTLK